MKDTNQNDKATAGLNTPLEGLIGWAMSSPDKNISGLARIASAEHAALVAVAEAMPFLLREFNQHVAEECRCPQVKLAADMAAQAMAQLAAVRK